MQRVQLSPGSASVTLNIAMPASLSVRATVPVEISLPAFWVVALKTPKTPSAATLPRAPITSAERSSLFLFLISVLPLSVQRLLAVRFPDVAVDAGGRRLRVVRRPRLEGRLDPEHEAAVRGPRRQRDGVGVDP